MDPVSPNPKRKRGRPATGRDPLITLRIPEELASQIDEWRARYEGMDRSAALRILLQRGLQASAEIDRDMQQAAEPPWSDEPRRTYVRRKLSKEEIAEAVARAVSRATLFDP
jgi:Arc/MetJ-type ribon-helix-helix transcriptional regulator